MLSFYILVETLVKVCYYFFVKRINCINSNNTVDNECKRIIE